MSSTLRIVMLLHKTVEHDARVRREARALREAGHEVVVVHLPRTRAEPPSAAGDGYELRSASPGDWSEALPGALRRALSAARIVRVARRERPDAVHAHDAAMLAPGWIVARRSGAMLVYDSHELATGVPYRSGLWARVVAAIERLFVARCDAVITVSDGIAERLQGRYGLQELPTVVRNLPDLPPPRGPAERDDLRQALGITAATPLILHHGAVAADRGCEALIRSMAQLPDAHLLFLGAEGTYVEGLERLARELGVEARVSFREPVPLGDLLSSTAQADVGVTLLEDTCENHRFALPNKAFEYVAAGIPVVASDLPELRRVIEAHGVGTTVNPDDPAEIASGLRAALDSRDEGMRERLAAAADQLTWRREQARLLGLYSDLGQALMTSRSDGTFSTASTVHPRGPSRRL